MSIAATDGAVVVDPYADQRSIESGFRRNRFKHILALIDQALADNDSIDILDLGGRELYWDIGAEALAERAGRVRIHLVNLPSDLQKITNTELFLSYTGDAADPRLLSGQQFDLVHSNSVIEHVGDWEQIKRFAANVRRLGTRYFVQTPNFWFPLEPHFRTPGFQWLPAAVRARMLQRRRLGFYERQPDYDEARNIIDSVHLLRRGQMATLFPDAEIHMERVFGLPKSIMAWRGNQATGQR